MKIELLETQTFNQDVDSDGYGDANTSSTGAVACPPKGYVANNTDCDDNSSSVNPTAVWYLDADNDGYYTGSGVTSCTSPGAGYKYTGLSGGNDCNDNNAAVNPTTVWYLDADNDTYYTGSGVTSCTSPGAGYKYTGLSGGNDCNDNNTAAIEVCDGVDNNCNGQVDEGFTNTDGDALADCVDPDDDNDGVLDVNDNCPLIANSNQLDTDNDGQGDVCDTDDDNDGVLDVNDNCPLIANSNQLDTDHDGQGDVCDTDDDNDGVADAQDNCPLVANTNQADFDRDGIGNACDTDDDNDGVPDAYDCAPLDKKNNKWLVCHKGQTICIDKKDINYHLGHGDKLGVCGTAARASGIQQQNLVPSSAALVVYPNPNQGQFALQLHHTKATKAEVVIADAKGVIVERRQVQLTEGKQTLSFNLGNKATGLYIVKVISEDGVQTTKVLVQR